MSIKGDRGVQRRYAIAKDSQIQFEMDENVERTAVNFIEIERTGYGRGRRGLGRRRGERAVKGRQVLYKERRKGMDRQ